MGALKFTEMRLSLNVLTTQLAIWNGWIIVMRGFLLSSSHACPSSSTEERASQRFVFAALCLPYSHFKCRLHMPTAPAPKWVCRERCSPAISTPQQAEISTCPHLRCAGPLLPVPQTRSRYLLPNSQSCNGQLWLTAPCSTYQRNSGAYNSSFCVGCAPTNFFPLPLALPVRSR